VNKPTARKKLGQILVDGRVIEKSDFEKALSEQKHSTKKLGEILAEKGICTEDDIAAAISSQLGIRQIDLKIAAVEPEAVQIIPEKWAVKHQLIPVSKDGRNLHVAMADPCNAEALEDAQFASGYQITSYVTTKSDIDWAIRKHYNFEGYADPILEDICSDTNLELIQEGNDQQPDPHSMKQQSEAAPIVKIVNHIVSSAVRQKASDIHAEPTRDNLLIRIRVDGALRVLSELPKWTQGGVISRMKIMAKLDIATKRIPQDGRVGIRLDGSSLDLRVSTLPTNYGEKVVIRILDPENTTISIDRLGLEGKNREKFLSLLSKPQGIILVTGPTGSGKTTTLYAALSRMRSVYKNITTIEDPIEYDLKGINQVAVHEKAGRTFPNILRAVLRQDPDIILLGEMRDAETGTTAMQASLTGHLVLSTIHTNSTVATITRLRDMGIPSYLIASTVIGIVAQRLVRAICPSCKVQDSPSDEDLRKIGLVAREAQGKTFFRGRGCYECGGTGFKGRVALYEILMLSQRIREYIANEATEAILRQLALTEGLVTLNYAGTQAVLNGTTSVSGLLHVSQSDEDFGSRCPACESVIDPEFVACPHCTRKLIDTCVGCGKIIDPSWCCCPYCSNKVREPARINEKRKIRRAG